MIKKLKTLEQLQEKFVHNNIYEDAILFRNADGGFEGKILKEMFGYFGEFISVKEYKNKKHGLRNYDWEIIVVNTHYYFQDNWFEADYLEDDLFEI